MGRVRSPVSVRQGASVSAGNPSTGEPFSEEGMTFIATVRLYGGQIVAHVFEGNA